MVLLGSCSVPGTRYGTLNQDFVLVEELHLPKDLKKNHWHQCYLAIVTDGHGMLGEFAARDAAHAILEHLKHSQLRRRQLGELPQEEVRKLVEEAFAAAHQRVLRLYDSPPRTYDYPKGSQSQEAYTLQTHANGEAVYTNALLGNRMLEFGTTATLAMLQGSTLVVGNVGDSMAVLGREHCDEAGEDTYSGVEVSVRHWGREPGEAKRLAEGWPDTVSIAPEDGYLTVEEGRLRGFQLAMTRALGHKLLAAYGVSAVPSVTFRTIEKEDVCLILASDGLWEIMSPGEAVQVVCDAIAEGRSVDAAARQLCTEAVRHAVSYCGAGEADNTTVAIFIFDEL